MTLRPPGCHEREPWFIRTPPMVLLLRNDRIGFECLAVTY